MRKYFFFFSFNYINRQYPELTFHVLQTPTTKKWTLKRDILNRQKFNFDSKILEKSKSSYEPGTQKVKITGLCRHLKNKKINPSV